MRKKYPTDLSDPEWNYIEAHMPTAKEHGRPRIPQSPTQPPILVVITSCCAHTSMTVPRTTRKGGAKQPRLLHFLPDQCLLVLKVTINFLQTNTLPLLAPLPTRPFSTTENQSLHAFRGVAIIASGPARARRGRRTQPLMLANERKVQIRPTLIEAWLGFPFVYAVSAITRGVELTIV
jgi:hypothetical protein